jgi:signal transduction histidine kinase
LASDKRTVSLRTKFLLIVLAGAVIPLGLIGMWLTRSAARSGEALLRGRLSGALDRGVQEIGARWVRQRSDLLTLVEAPAAARPQSFAELGPGAVVAVFRDAADTERWTLGDANGGSDPLVPVTVDVYAPGTGQRLGTLEVRVRAGALLEVEPASVGLAGAVLAAFDRSSGGSLLPLPFDPALLGHDRFRWGGDDWLALRRLLDEPPLELVAAAPLTPFTQPFEDAARASTAVVAAVAFICIGLAVLLTTRMTRSLERLAAAAEAVSRGNLERQVDASSADEVGRVAKAFNAMIESLRRTLAELAQRQSLAAVGEFASALAHEIRNPLTAIRVDLQRVEESLPADSAFRDLQRRALGEVDRLDRAVNGALRIARSGRITRVPLDLRVPLQAAMEAARPEFGRRAATLEPLPADPASVSVRGDAAALEQVFLNLLLNAAQALDAGGRAGIAIRSEAGRVVITVRDDGRGIPPEQLDQVFESFFSTRPDGTGLGLPIARQIVLAHGGAIHVENAPERGTAVHVTLPAQVAAGA